MHIVNEYIWKSVHSSGHKLGHAS